MCILADSEGYLAADYQWDDPITKPEFVQIIFQAVFMCSVLVSFGLWAQPGLQLGLQLGLQRPGPLHLTEEAISVAIFLADFIRHPYCLLKSCDSSCKIVV